MTSTMTNLSPAELAAQHVYHLLNNGDQGAALIAARAGWRDFPDFAVATASGDMTFEKLTTILAAKLGEAAEPAPVEQVAQVSAPPVAPVSAAPVFAAPVSAPPAAPVSVAPAGPVSIVTVERTESDGTIIRVDKTMPKLLPIIGNLGWKFAKRGFMYLGDRDTAPNMAAISQTLAALAANGIQAQSTVTGAEPARPVSAVPVSAPRAPRVARPTRRQAARAASPVTVRQVSPAAPVAPTFVPPVSAPPAAPVSVAPAAPVVDPAMAMMMQQMQAMQKQLATLMGQQAPAAPVAAPVAPAAPVAEPVMFSAEDALASLIDEKERAVIREVEQLTWQFRLADGANGRKTATELREQLRQRVAEWWAHHHLGAVVFGVFVDGTDAKVLHIRVSSASGELSARKISEQVVGTALTVKGIFSRSTTKKA